MKLLTTAEQINAELARLIQKCKTCRIAVAWASVGFPTFELLRTSNSKIAKMIVGTHFYQTHPEFIENFLSHPNVRFFMKTDGVFHPKVYYFETNDHNWECIVGSSNLTRGGLNINDEMALVVTDRDDGAEVRRGVIETIDTYWQNTETLSSSELEAYCEAWKRKQPVLRNLRGQFGPHSQPDKYDKGKSPLNVPILRMTWPEYFDRVRSEQDHAPHDHSIEGRLKVIRVTRKLFADNDHFKDIDSLGRKKIAGLVMEDGINYLWFGSMRGAGRFQHAITTNSEEISNALDAIPSDGPVTMESYLTYISGYTEAFRSGGDGIATATRLLAMKRPDTFICFDNRNKNELCKHFAISRNIGYQAYWDSIIERTMESTWWQAPPPQSGVELEVWKARAAFLDSLFYDGKDMPAI